MIGADLIDWNALGEVVLYSVVAGVGVPAIYALVVRAAARSGESPRGSTSATTYAVLSALGGLVCIAAVAYGIWVMTQK